MTLFGSASYDTTGRLVVVNNISYTVEKERKITLFVAC